MIDTSTWKEFKISDLFDVKNSKSISDKRGLDFDENNPYDFIGRTPANNGIQGKIVKQDFEPNNENTFSVTQIGEKLCLFRDNKWYACQNIFLLTPLYPELITTKFFICCVVTKTLKVVFGEDAYSSYPTKDTLSDMMVKLPVTSDGQPDWDYMESYMKAVMEESEKSLENLKKADDTKHLIDVSGWGEFDITELFDMSLPKGDLQIKKVDDGDVPLITPSNFNNGMLQRISEHSKSTLYDKGSLTVDMFGNAYYQEEDFFVTAHGHVNVLMPKMALNVYTGTFLASTIRAMFFDKYGFNEMCTQKVLKAESIWLPITSTGEPDWQYMEDYMRRIMDKSEQIISDLQIGA